MSEYIKREEATDIAFRSPFFSDALVEEMNAIPAADVAPVRHGRWISVKNPQWPAYSHDQCSICGWWNTKNAVCRDGGKYNRAHSLNYCPNCGAKMDLEDEDNG